MRGKKNRKSNNPAGRPKRGQVQNDEHARTILTELAESFCAASLDGDTERYREALAKIEVLGVYMNFRGYGQNGKLDIESKELTGAKVSTTQLSEYSGWSSRRIWRRLKSTGAGQKIGGFWYLSKKDVAKHFPEWFNEDTK